MSEIQNKINATRIMTPKIKAATRHRFVQNREDSDPVILDDMKYTYFSLVKPRHIIHVNLHTVIMLWKQHPSHRGLNI